MKIKLWGRKEKPPRAEALPPVWDDGGWAAYLGGRGHAVNALTALKVSAVFRCVDVIAKTIASLPLHLYYETESGKEKARGHPLYPILHTLPNEHTTAYEFWHMYVVNLLLTRGAFARIERDGRGVIAGLTNIPTSQVAGVYANSINGERYIHVMDGDGRYETLRTGGFMYTPSMRFQSDTDPSDPIAIAADVLGLTVGLNEFARVTFERGTNPGGYIEHPGQMSDEAYARFKEDFQKNYVGVANAGKWMLLEEGSKAVAFTRDMERTQALESRKFAVTEICRIFGVPPHLVYDLERATFSNIEHQSTEFAQNCITPMSVRIEQTIYKDLLTRRERTNMYAKIATNGMVRGDMKSRTYYYNVARQNGWMNADEIRELEDMNKIPDGLGETYAVNGNMKPLTAMVKGTPEEGGNDESERE